MDQLVATMETVNGRDKVMRLLQYASKFVWALLQNAIRSKNVRFIERLQRLEKALSVGRQFMRIGRFLQFLRTAQRSLHHSNIVSRLTLTMSRVAHSLFLFVDNGVWLANYVLSLPSSQVQPLVKLSAKFWLVSIVCNLIRDFYLISDLKPHLGSGIQQYRHLNDLFEHSYERSLLLDCIRNACDIALPLNMMGTVQISSHVLGFLGCVSSLLGLLSLLKSQYRLPDV